MNLFDTFDGIILFQLLLITVYILFDQKGKRNNLYIAVFFFVQANGIIDSFIWRYFNWCAVNIPYFIFIPQIILKLWGPFFYTYIRSVTTPDFRLKKTDIIHLLPMSLFAALIISNYFRFPTIIVKRDSLLQWTFFAARETTPVLILAQIVNFGYIIAALFHLKRYSADVKSFYSSLNRVNFRWLLFFAFGFSSIWVIDTFGYAYSSLTGNAAFVTYLIHPMILVLACCVTVYGWKNPDIFVSPFRKGMYKKYPLTGSQKLQFLEQLRTSMTEKKPYLDPELTLRELSEISSVPERYLSRLLNDTIGQNFYDYVNSFRIQEAIIHLENSDKVRRNILTILYDVGFNSKTSFNVAFKKHTGMSPTKYKKLKSESLSEVI
ncbi:MAG TPA: AraC family transcriptional regulator [Spirochaetota bacterium]